MDGNGGATAADQAETEHLRRVHIAACALLLELAHADDDFTEAERMHIEAVLRRHFQLDEATALELMALSQEARGERGGLPRFARLIRDSYDAGQRTLLAEIMWGLILSDGRIARHEASMLRRITGLLDLEAGYLSDVRNPDAHEDD